MSIDSPATAGDGTPNPQRQFVRGVDFVYNVDHIVGVRVQSSTRGATFNVEGTVIGGQTFLYREGLSAEEAKLAIAEFASTVAQEPETIAIHTTSVFKPQGRINRGFADMEFPLR